jgi:hypothetical protein
MSNYHRSRLRALWLCGATALGSPAFAGDRPADDAGVRTIADFLGSYAGKAALPSIKVSQDGSVYHVSFDIGAASAAIKSSGVVYDSTVLQFKVYQQDDGQWRIESEETPPITAHILPKPGQANGVELNARIETVNLATVTHIDPKLNWFGAVQGHADTISVVERGPGVEETLDFSGLKIDGGTTSGPSGLVTTIHEPLQSMNFAMDVDAKGVDPATHGPRKPVHVSGQGEGGKFEVSIADFQPQPLLDGWRFLVAHPERPDVARDFDKLRPVLSALAADHLKFEETGSLEKLNVMTESGPVVVEGIAGGIGLANMGPKTGAFERIAVRSIKLPDSLTPPMYGPFIPVSFNFGVKGTGFDVEAATKEWLADAKLDGDGPMLSTEDQAKVADKFIGGRPILVEIEPSHLKGPNLDLALEGKITIDKGDRTGAIKVVLRDFPKTEEALQGLPPQLAQQVTPVVAMVKGLATNEPDGSLVWVCTLGHDHIMKVNGLPLGKAPF